MNQVWISDQTGKAKNVSLKLKRRLIIALEALKISNAEISLALTSDKKIKELNHQYRKKNHPTDVLAFSQNSSPHKEQDHQLLGDIVISAPTARRQAKEHRRSQEDEFTILALHGLLHLLGYTHENKAQSKVMFKLQDQLFELVRPRV